MACARGDEMEKEGDRRIEVYVWVCVCVSVETIRVWGNDNENFANEPLDQEIATKETDMEEESWNCELAMIKNSVL